jgi:hypothetical protein
MAETPSAKLSFLIRQTELVALGLERVFYGMLSSVFAGLFSHPHDKGIYTTLICFLLYYFFGISLTLSLTESLNCFSAMKRPKRGSSMVLLILILIMYLNEIVLVALNWYLEWLTYVKYSGSEDQATAILFTSEETPLTVLYIIAVTSLLATLRLGVADSIMVLTLYFEFFLNRINYLGMALLDHLQL